MMNRDIKLMWKIYSLALQCSTALSPPEKEKEIEADPDASGQVVVVMKFSKEMQRRSSLSGKEKEIEAE